MEGNQKELLMSDLKERAKDKIDAAAEAGKQATDKVFDKTKDVVHTAGKKLDEGAKKLKNA
jgi:hypothetical protein